MQLLTEECKDIAPAQQLTPDALCQAMRDSRIQLNPEQADQVLVFAAAHNSYTCLHSLDLILTADSSLQKLELCQPSDAAAHPFSQTFFLQPAEAADAAAAGIHDLLSVCPSRQVQPSAAWDQLSR